MLIYCINSTIISNTHFHVLVPTSLLLAFSISEYTLHYCSFMCPFCSLFLLEVPAQMSGFEAEAELDSRIMLSWNWPVQDPIISFELLYWEANNPTDKVHSALQTLSAGASGMIVRRVKASAFLSQVQ